MMQYSVVHWKIKDTQDGVEVRIKINCYKCNVNVSNVRSWWI